MVDEYTVEEELYERFQLLKEIFKYLPNSLGIKFAIK